MKEVKQVLIIRRDLKMRRGKEIAQGAHAAMAFLTRRLQKWGLVALCTLKWCQVQWIWNGFKKVTLQVDTEAELLGLKEQAEKVGLEVHLITDSGHTEFHMVPTNTVLAIGPNYSKEIDPITGALKLY